MPLITDKHYLDPVLPENQFPADLREKAHKVIIESHTLNAQISPELGQRLRSLLQITNSYYSNLIEGQYTETADMEKAKQSRVKTPKQLTDLAVAQMVAQEVLEGVIEEQQTGYKDLFGSSWLSECHKLIFENARPEDLVLDNGRTFVPGKLRSIAGIDEVTVGQHVAPAAQAVEGMLAHLAEHFGRISDAAMRLIAVLAYHHRAAWVHPFLDGNGRTIRMITQLQLTQLGLSNHLWSISRGLARKRTDYYQHLAMADKPKEGAYDGRGQMSQRHYYSFIGFMLDVCLDQIHYMKSALDRAHARQRIDLVFKFHPMIIDEGIKPSTGPALHALLTQGSMPRAEFKQFLGLGERMSTRELSSLVKLGLVVSPSPKARDIEIGMPVWFAQEIFPDLHRRFQ